MLQSAAKIMVNLDKIYEDINEKGGETYNVLIQDLQTENQKRLLEISSQKSAKELRRE